MGDPSFAAVLQYCLMVLSRNLARSSHYPSVPVQWRCRCIYLSLAARSEAVGVAWTRAHSDELIVAAPLISPARKPCQTGPEGERGKEGREPNKEMQPETGRSLPLGAFRLALLLAPKLVMRRGRGLPSGHACDVALRVQGSAHPSVGVIGQGGLLRKCQMSGANTRSPY